MIIYLNNCAAFKLCHQVPRCRVTVSARSVVFGYVLGLSSLSCQWCVNRRVMFVLLSLLEGDELSGALRIPGIPFRVTHCRDGETTDKRRGAWAGIRQMCCFVIHRLLVLSRSQRSSVDDSPISLLSIFVFH